MNVDIRGKLRQIVFAHTAAGSKHQHAALDMVDDHLKRRFVPRIETMQCHECKRSFEGVRWTKPTEPEGPAPTFSQISEIVDTWGFIESESVAACAACMLRVDPGTHIKCHHCLDEGYIGDIYDPKKKKDEPLLIDLLYRQTFKKPPLRNDHLRQTLESARRFVLSDEMTAFWIDLTWKAFHGMAGSGMLQSHMPRFQRKIFARLDEFRHFSRLPHKVTWLECSREARNNRMEEIMRSNDLPLTQYSADGSVRSENTFEREKWEGSGQRCGYLLMQHDQIETAFTCTEFFNFDKDNPLVEFHGASPCWQTDDDPLPWKCEATQPFREFNTGSELGTGIRGYIRPNVGFRPTASKGELTDDELVREYRKSAIAGKGILRYLWTFLATLNKIPLIGQQEIKRSHGFVARGRYRHFLSHQTITLHVPEKARAKVISKAISDIRRRAHMVRGHWRDDYRLQKGNKALWIAEHQRGDASIGFVTHDYAVQHEQQRGQDESNSASKRPP